MTSPSILDTDRRSKSTCTTTSVQVCILRKYCRIYTFLHQFNVTSSLCGTLFRRLSAISLYICYTSLNHKESTERSPEHSHNHTDYKYNIIPSSVGYTMDTPLVYSTDQVIVLLLNNNFTSHIPPHHKHSSNIVHLLQK